MTMAARSARAARPTRVGVVSDTHGTVDPRVPVALDGVDYIVHAGDVGAPDVLRRLGTIAPVTAVRGNVDDGDLRRDLPGWVSVNLDGVRFVVTHIRGVFDWEDAGRMGADVFVFGHTHMPFAEEHDGVLLLNPGSVSRARAGHPRSVAVVEVRAGQVVEWRIVSLEEVVPR
jgi:putative phosphoesterase